MELDEVSREPALAVREIEESYANDLDDSISWCSTEGLASGFKKRRSRSVARAAWVRNLRDQRQLRFFEISQNKVEVAIVLRTHAGETGANNEHLQFCRCEATTVRQVRCRSWKAYKIRDGRRPWDGIDKGCVVIQQDLHRPALDPAS